MPAVKSQGKDMVNQAATAAFGVSKRARRKRNVVELGNDMGLGGLIHVCGSVSSYDFRWGRSRRKAHWRHDRDTTTD